MKLIVLSFGVGSLQTGFTRISAQIWQQRNSFPCQIIASLPADPSLENRYLRWRDQYFQLQNGLFPRIQIHTSASITHYSDVDFLQDCQDFSQSLNRWLSVPEFANLEKQLRTQLAREEEILLLVETDNEQLRAFPWHLWQLWDDYPNMEIGLCCSQFHTSFNLSSVGGGEVRILGILGDTTNINVNADREFLEKIPNAKIEFLVEPSLEELQQNLWNEDGWDILFFAGHSQTECGTGYFYLHSRPEGRISIAQLKYSLKKASQQGLHLTIFNSCDGLGLAKELADLQIPQTIVMREPVPDQVAQSFLKFFIPAFAGGKSITLALRETRERLHSLEPKFLCASWLPVLYQNPAAPNKTWQELGRGSSQLPKSPYRGIESFKEEDATLFIGREKLTDSLIAAVQSRPITAVIGASGIGKSSLVFAGLVPYLRHLNWEIVSFRPGKAPFTSLTTALSAAFPGIDNASNSIEDRLVQLPQQSTNSLLLIIDQFEEIYTLCHEVSEREQFLGQLLQAVQNLNKVKLVLTLRADFVGQALTYRPLADALQYADLKVGPMNRQELEAAITVPAGLMGVKLEEGLTERLLDAIANEPGNLALLEFTLTQLWEKQSQGQLTHAAYQKIGGLSQALSRYAEQTYNQLNNEEQKAAQRIFISLIQINEGLEETRRQVEKKDLLQISSPNIVEPVLQKLTHAKLLTTNSIEEAAESKIVVDLAHEALIRHWSLLQYWVQENRGTLRQAQQLEGEAKLWTERGQLRRREYLLSGKKLQEAKSFQIQFGQDVALSTEARNLIQFSSVAQTQQRLITLFFVGGFFLTTTLSLTGWGLRQYQRYWATMSRVQTVDFNILFHSLPSKLSLLLLAEEFEEVQATLNSNYSLFGLVVTDCPLTTQECPQQNILYTTQNPNYWFRNTLTVEDLADHPYDFLQDPPPLFTSQSYFNPYATSPEPTGVVNPGTVIGRVYYVRRKRVTHNRGFWRWIFALDPKGNSSKQTNP